MNVPMSQAALRLHDSRWRADTHPGLEAVAASGRCKRGGSTDRTGLRRPTPATVM